MTTTPPSSTLAEGPVHQPPSLPTSPFTKRPKTMASSAPMTDQTSVPLLVKKLSSSAKAPTRGSAFAAGYDVYSAKDTTVPARGKTLVDTDIAIAVPEGTCKLPPHNLDRNAKLW